MSADRQFNLQAKTDNGNIHAVFMQWAAKVKEQPAVRITREDIITAWSQDPNMAGHVARLKREVPKGSTMFITEAASVTSSEGPEVTLTVRYG
jgi:hypothetical protein